MREYRIFKTDLGWSIYRKKQVGKLLFMQFLTGKNVWSTNKGYTRVFYKREDAEGAMVTIKVRDKKRNSMVG